MTRYALFLLLHFAVCAAWFLVVQKPLFLALTRRASETPVSRKDVRGVFAVGYVTDFIAAAYLTGFPFLVMWVHIHLPYFPLRAPLLVAEGIVALALALSTCADTALYPFWKFKLDSSALAYLKSLKGTVASVSKAYVVGALLLVVLAWGLAFAMLGFLAEAVGIGSMSGVSGWWHIAAAAMFIVLGLTFFAVIRGIEHRPNTPCMVYRSSNMWLNHAALNPLYNFIYSFSVNDRASGDAFVFMDREECDRSVAKLFPTEGTPARRLLTTKRPNVLFIVWESLSSRFVEELGGKAGVLPRFEAMSREGVLFTNVDAGSFRTDRGLVCLLSGYLGQPTMSIIRDTRKLPSLPALPRRLRELGYTTEAIHGGDLKIMHKNDYYMTAGHTLLRGIEAFPADAPRCSWGVHDGAAATYVADECQRLQAEGKPWMLTWQTLSSHQPFRVPYSRLDNPIHNAFAYTDEAVGSLIDTLRADAALWSNLLVVIIGDHGLNNTDEPLTRAQYVRIPLLLTGGAVAAPGRIGTLMAQTDLPATLLGQMELPHSEFRFSRDVLAPSYAQPFTFHAYNNGFLLHDLHGYTDYDNAAARAVRIDGPDPANRELIGRMILQSLYDNIRAL